MMDQYMASYEYCSKEEIDKVELQEESYFPELVKRLSVGKLLDGTTAIPDLTPVQREQLREDLQIYEEYAKEMRPSRIKVSRSFDTLPLPKTYLEATKQNMDHAFATVEHTATLGAGR
jgi:hypothetical protein